MIEKRIMIIAVLALFAVILTIVRESGETSGTTFSFIPDMKKEISGDDLYALADTTLQTLGITKRNIRPIKNRNDVRVLIPQTFDPIDFVKAITILLEDYDAAVVSFDNTKEKTTLVQFKKKDLIIKSFLFSYEPVPTAKKGVSSSVPKKQIR